jgi:hypothetical protein
MNNLFNIITNDNIELILNYSINNIENDINYLILILKKYINIKLQILKNNNIYGLNRLELFIFKSKINNL